MRYKNNDINIIDLCGEWKLKGDKYELLSKVPGDITNDLFKESIIDDPYYGNNSDKISWILESEWIYIKKFRICENQISSIMKLVFDGIDTYSKIYLNGKLLGNTDSMFVSYMFDIKNIINIGENILEVVFSPISKEIKKYKNDKYISVFNSNRIFIRKAQCHFGWDWAPKFGGYGIYRDVYIIRKSDYYIEHVQIITNCSGNITLLIKLNKKFEGELRIKILNNEEKIVSYYGKKDFFCRKMVNLHISSPKLWWPSGYGNQPLYKLQIELLLNQNLEDVYYETFGIREIKLIQPVINNERIGFYFSINGRKIFARGSNWIPSDCMTGRIESEKYEKLICIAKESNFNMLRVWGGGIYESDFFYDLCDKYGILIWQDFMFACQDIPDDNEEFRKKIIEEGKFQVMRLRNHASICYWCGINEGVGAYCEAEKKYGKESINILLRGIVAHYDGTRPYGKESPYAYADVQCNKCEGDNHDNLSELALFGANFQGFEKYDYNDESKERKIRIQNYHRYALLCENNFTSECAVMGICSLASLRKFIPQKNQNVGDKMLENRFLGNPFTTVMPNFSERQLVISEALFGNVISISDLIKKCQRAQKDILFIEGVYTRLNKNSGGILNWMYNDIWPTGTWSVVDYYLDKKAGLYGLKKAFEPLLFCIIPFKDRYCFSIVNNTNVIFKEKVMITYYDYQGNIKKQIKKQVNVDVDKIKKYTLPECDCDYIEAVSGEKYYDVIDCKKYELPNYIPKYKLSSKCKKISNNYYKTKIKISSETFLPCVRLYSEEGNFTDNYFDIGANRNKIVYLYSHKIIKWTMSSFLTNWDDLIKEKN